MSFDSLQSTVFAGAQPEAGGELVSLVPLGDGLGLLVVELPHAPMTATNRHGTKLARGLRTMLPQCLNSCVIVGSVLIGLTEQVRRALAIVETRRSSR